MPKITFLPSNQIVEFQKGSLPYKREGLRESVLDVALNYGVELRHACGGICSCITCHVVVERGDACLSPMQTAEEALLYRVPGYSLHSRLACQAAVRGDVVVRIPAPGDTS